MLTNKDYCDYDTCVALRELGYNEPSNYTYHKHCRVSNEILAKYPGLSDSGYQDLIWDGLYTHNEVYKIYIEPLETYSRNSLINDCETELCSCIHLYEAQKWLREEKDIIVDVRYGYPYYNVVLNSRIMGTRHIVKDKNKRIADFFHYEEALSEGIKEAVKILKEK